MFSLVFVSVKLSGEPGNHLFAFGGETLLADGFPPPPPESQNSHRVTFWLPDPSAWDPRTPLLPSRGKWVALAPRPHSWFYLDMELTGTAKPLVPSPGAFSALVCGLPHTHWENQTASCSIPFAHWLDSNEALTGLFAFLSFITVILIWTCSLDFKVAWLYCVHFRFHCTAVHSQWMLHTSC